MQILLIIIGIIFLVFVLRCFYISKENANLHKELLKYQEIEKKLDNNFREIELKKKELLILEQKQEQWKKEQIDVLNEKKLQIEMKENNYRDKIHKEYENLIQNMQLSMPWLAGMVSDFYDVIINQKRCTITNVSELKAELKELKRENKLLEYNLEYVKKLLPEIEETIDVDIASENSLEFLTYDEYISLSDTEKNKLALERYFKSSRSKHDIGRDFEMYVGYRYELLNYKVTYFGLSEKLHDLGRDLIAENEDSILIIQCKYWSKNKTIYEKHLCQLFGTTVKYYLENKPTKTVKPVFVCHNSLSETAKEFAKQLNIQVYEEKEIKEYPSIKCNVETGIYHLPFDQQYDQLKMENAVLVNTIEEAEALNCRRAYKWRGK